MGVEIRKNNQWVILTKAQAVHVVKERYWVTVKSVPPGTTVRSLDGARLRVNGAESVSVWGRRCQDGTLVLDVLLGDSARSRHQVTQVLDEWIEEVNRARGNLAAETGIARQSVPVGTYIRKGLNNQEYRIEVYGSESKNACVAQVYHGEALLNNIVGSSSPEVLSEAERYVRVLRTAPRTEPLQSC